MTEPSCLSDFVGAWRLSREINDALTEQCSRFDGQAHLRVEDEGRLSYHEMGTLTLPHGASMHAERRYVWTAMGSGIDILFEDGRFFHHLALVEAQHTAHHDCPPDVYDVTYAFDAWPDWSTQWRVHGPRKDYVMVTRYEPLTPVR